MLSQKRAIRLLASESVLRGALACHFWIAAWMSRAFPCSTSADEEAKAFMSCVFRRRGIVAVRSEMMNQQICDAGGPKHEDRR